MIIRKAKIKDLKSIIDLFILFRKEDDKFLSGFLLYIARLNKNYKAELNKELRKYIYAKNKAAYVAEDKNKVIGFVLGYIKDYPKFFKVNREGYIDALFVARKYRGKGISSMLKENIFKWFAEKKMKYAGLDTAQNNKHAQKIYKKWGFNPLSIVMKAEIKK